MIPKRVRCPQCGRMVEYRNDNPSRPFCGERCKLIDLGAWAEERYSIPSVSASIETTGQPPDEDAGNQAEDSIPPAMADRRLN